LKSKTTIANVQEVFVGTVWEAHVTVLRVEEGGGGPRRAVIRLATPELAALLLGAGLRVGSKQVGSCGRCIADAQLQPLQPPHRRR